MLSASEKKRRYSALRGVKRDAGADALVVVSRAGHGEQCGYIRYVSDFHLSSRHAYGVFVGDSDPNSEPIMVVQTPSHRWLMQDASGLADVRDRPRQVEEVGDILAGLPNPPKLVLIAGMTLAMPVADYLYLRERFPNTRFEDATVEVQRVKAIKSPEEIELVRESCRIADAGFRRFLEVARPGRPELEVVAAAEEAMRKSGALDILVLIAGSNRGAYIELPSDHVLHSGEVVNFNVECSGPSGYWVQRGGPACLGEPSREMRKLYDDAIEAVAEGARMIKPGVVAGEVAEQFNRLIENRGHDLLHWAGHVIGLDVIDGPVLLKAERRPFEEGMVFVLEPKVADKHGNGVYLAETFVVTPNGGESFTQIPFELHVI